MKNIIILMVLVLTAVFTGCEDDGYDAPNSFSDVGWYTSALRAEEYNIGIDDFISFSDLSQGSVDHTWTITEGSFYLDSPISRNDSVYDSFIINPLSKVSNEETVHILFKQSGLTTVNLYNTFKDSVTFNGVRGSEEIILPSVRVGDLWVIDTTFIVDVYDTIIPLMRVEQLGVTVPHESNLDTIYVEAGDNIQLFDETVQGRPDTWNWRIGTETASGQEATMVLKKLGVFEGQFSASRTEQTVPGDWELYHIPAPFKVIPSSKPFVLAGDIIELENETIQVPFNGEFQEFTEQEEFFTVKVNGVVFPVLSASLNPTDATLIELVLNEPIYRPDVITVTLEEGSSLESTDTRTPVTFIDEPVVMHDVNLFNDSVYGFEDGPEGAFISTDAGTAEYVTDVVYSGNYALKLTGTGGWARASGEEEPAVLPAGTYNLSYKILIDEANTAGSFGPWIYWATGDQQKWKGMGWPQQVIKGEWMHYTDVVNIPDAGPVHFAIRIGEGGILTVDEVRIVKTEVRP